MPEPIERLVLPRLDWYDSEGRINKDALIENFNAIEAKINEISDVSAFTINAPDFSTFNYDDTTLESADNKIVNIKSLVDILKLKGFPIVCTFNDKVLKKLQYYNDNYQLVTITDVNLSSLGTNNQIYVYLDYSEDLVYISNDYTNPNNDILIACYDNGIVYSTDSLGMIDVNILQVMAGLQKGIVNINLPTGGWFTITRGNRMVGYTGVSKSNYSFNTNFRDLGF